MSLLKGCPRFGQETQASYPLQMTAELGFGLRRGDGSGACEDKLETLSEFPATPLRLTARAPCPEGNDLRFT